MGVLLELQVCWFCSDLNVWQAYGTVCMGRHRISSDVGMWVRESVCVILIVSRCFVFRFIVRKGCNPVPGGLHLPGFGALGVYLSKAPVYRTNGSQGGQVMGPLGRCKKFGILSSFVFE
jgi:hypothetical protein